VTRDEVLILLLFAVIVLWSFWRIQLNRSLKYHLYLMYTPSSRMRKMRLILNDWQRERHLFGLD
jgi:hypothetical protein